MKFSVIVPHYDGSISDAYFERGIKCLCDQTSQDFEVLIYHDGPISRPIPKIYEQLGDRCSVFITKNRENNWGHGNRNRGIKIAKGEYIIHFNPDNVLYKHAIDKLSKVMEDKYEIITPNDIIIFPILMRGMQSNGKIMWRDLSVANDRYLIFSGFPPYKYNIDCMQLVMRTSIWKKHGGWVDKTKEGDGNMYPEFVATYGARYCSEVLGEHW